jgi:hypothetical protein
MKKYAILYFLFCSLLASSCKEKPADREHAVIAEGVHHLKPGSKYSWLVILPGLGCKGCIQEAEAFMRDYLDRKDILFVLTKVQSIKILQQKIGKTLTDRGNVLIDKEGYFDIPTNNTIYPCIVQVKDGQAMKHQFQSPANGQAFEWLKMQVD